jgi:hypothetical protein
VSFAFSRRGTRRGVRPARQSWAYGGAELLRCTASPGPVRRALLATSRRRDVTRAKEAVATGRLFLHGANRAVALSSAAGVGVGVGRYGVAWGSGLAGAGRTGALDHIAKTRCDQSEGSCRDRPFVLARRNRAVVLSSAAGVGVGVGRCRVAWGSGLAGAGGPGALATSRGARCDQREGR